jgi:uncharacterized membrane protein
MADTTSPASNQEATPKTVAENIRSVLGMQAALEHRRTFVDRVADLIADFSGSMNFVFIHIVCLLAWFLINTLPLGIRHFDPYPFILLAMIVSVEGVLLSTFVLMKQNRMQYRADIREQLDLQVNLLAEKEVTKTLQLLRAICEKLEIEPNVDQDAELQEMASTTSVDMLAERIQTDLEPKE